jgi:hypothetical protein
MQAQFKLALVVVDALIALVLLWMAWLIHQQINTAQLHILGAGIALVAYVAMAAWARSDGAVAQDDKRGQLNLVSREGDISVYSWTSLDQET